MSSENTLLARFSLLFLTIAMVVGYVSQINFDAWQRYGNAKIRESYNVYIEPQPFSPAAAQFVSFGAHEFVADVYWLKLIQYYGGGDPQGKYRKLAELFNTVTELSPKFTAAYTTGLLVLPGEGFVDQALALAAKGEKNLPDSWEIPYNTGLVYHVYKKDYVQAAKEFEKAAALPNAPANARYFAAVYYNQADQRQTAYQIFKTLYDSSDNDFVKDRAKKYVEHLDIFFALQDAIHRYQEKFHQAPDNLNQLVDKKIISTIPVSPLSIKFAIDPKTKELIEQKGS